MGLSMRGISCHFGNALPTALESHYHSLLPPVVREALDQMRKRDSLRLAPIADGFDDVRSEIDQTEDARDVASIFICVRRFLYKESGGGNTIRESQARGHFSRAYN